MSVIIQMGPTGADRPMLLSVIKMHILLTVFHTFPKELVRDCAIITLSEEEVGNG